MNKAETVLPGLPGAKLEMYRKQIGAMSADEALALALESEQFANDCGRGDIAYPTFNRQKEIFINYAELLEKEENFIKQLHQLNELGNK